MGVSVARQTLSLTLQNSGAAMAREVGIDDAIVAGWTGRDAAAVEKHITELAALGAHSGGEVEFVLLQHGGRMWVGAGSDHTDREVETYGVTVSKQMCDKPVAPVFWAFDDVAPHWDQLTLRAHVTEGGARVLYQEGAVAAMLPPADLLARHAKDGRLADDTLMFCGTLAAK